MYCFYDELIERYKCVKMPNNSFGDPPPPNLISGVFTERSVHLNTVQAVNFA